MSKNDDNGNSGSDLSPIMEEGVNVQELLAGGSGLSEGGKLGSELDPLRSIRLQSRWASVDAEEFRELCLASVSLTVAEKRRILEAFGHLSNFQTTELIRIWKGERLKFDELEKRHAERLAEVNADLREHEAASKVLLDSVAKKEETSGDAAKAELFDLEARFSELCKTGTGGR